MRQFLGVTIIDMLCPMKIMNQCICCTLVKPLNILYLLLIYF